jgi:hypothetical protein
MTSQLKVDKLQGRTTAGSITVTSEGTSVETNLQQGLCKAWVHHDQEGSHDIDDSFNMTSIADSAVGRTTYTLTNNMANATYPTPFQAWDSAKFLGYSQGFSKTTSSWGNARTDAEASGSEIDADQVGETVFGDLA